MEFTERVPGKNHPQIPPISLTRRQTRLRAAASYSEPEDPAVFQFSFSIEPKAEKHRRSGFIHISIQRLQPILTTFHYTSIFLTFMYDAFMDLQHISARTEQIKTLILLSPIRFHNSSWIICLPA